MSRGNPKAHKIQPIERSPYNSISFPNYKKRAEKVIGDFCLPQDIYKALLKKIEAATSEYQVDQVLKEARKYI
jgi:hypothetical protein